MTIDGHTCRGTNLLGLLGVLLATGVQAQTTGCTTTERSDPPGRVLTCPGGLVIRAEADSSFSLVEKDGRPVAANLGAKALLIELPPSKRGFQILTPHAIAAVRGTVWAVDVGAGQTSVFVRRGKVAVRRPSGRAVVLGAGDGVDVSAGGGDLSVTRWKPARVAALLARFGR